MMGIDDILISFAISVAAGNVPTIKSLIKKESLQDRLNSSFSKALKKWTKDEFVQTSMLHELPKHIKDLENYIRDSKRGINPMIKQLLQLWIEEIKNDEVCSRFLVNHKQDLLSIKLDTSTAHLKKELMQPIQAILDEQREQSLKTDKLLQLMTEIQQNQYSENNNKHIIDSLLSLLNGSITSLIEELKTKTASDLLNQFETLFSKAISENCCLKAEILYRKAQIVSFKNPNKAFKLYHEAYLLINNDIKFRRGEIKYLINSNRIIEATDLANSLPENDELKWIISIISSMNIPKDYDKVQQILKTNKNLKHEILEYIYNKNIDCSFLFDAEEPEIPEVLTYSNIKTWLFIITQYRVNLQDILCLSFEDPQIKLLEKPFKVTDKFINLLNKTEIHDYYPIVKCLHCYWGYLTSRNKDFLDEYLSIDKKNFNEQHYYFTLIEASLFVLEKRNKEAFSAISSICDKLDDNLIKFVVASGIYTKNATFISWIINLCKERQYLICDPEATLIAHSVNPNNAIVLKDDIEKTEFKNKTTKNVLIQLCNYNAKQQIDVSTFEDRVSSLSDALLSYASLLLSCSGKSQLAFELMRPIVNESISDIKQRIFLDILSSMQEKSPDLYKILVQNRKAGNFCDDALLHKEYLLASNVSDFQNAFEAIEEIYKRHPDDTNVFTHYIIKLGLVYPEKLKDYEEKILNANFINNQNVFSVYEILAENNYIEIAAELLYKHARQSEDYQFRTTYHNEAYTGLISFYVKKEFEVAENGQYVLCDIKGVRKFYKVAPNYPIGKALFGVHKNDEVNINIAFEEKKLIVVGIFSKYYKLAWDIIQEAQDGSNPTLIPFKFDKERPLESFEAIIKQISPNNKSLEEQNIILQEKYQRGEIGLAQLITDDDILAGYYKILFTPFRVNVSSCILTLENLPEINDASVFVLDLPTIIIFAEFTAKTGFVIEGNKIITTVLHEYLKTSLKTIRRISGNNMFDALRSNYIKKYSDNIDEDEEEHVKNILQWVQLNCKDVIPTNALGIIDPIEKMPIQNILISSLSLLIDPNIYFVTDDKYLSKLLPTANIISSETFVKIKSNENVKKAYTNFLFECNFVGIDLTDDFIVNEYHLMKNFNNVRMNSILQSLNINPYLLIEVTNAALQLAQIEQDIEFFKTTFTNMYVMIFKGFAPLDRASIIDKLEKDLISMSLDLPIILNCIHNAHLSLNE